MQHTQASDPKIHKNKDLASHGENTIRDWLIANQIVYETQKTFETGIGCKDKRWLPFDFFIIVNGHCGIIEYDGAQHFQIVPRFHGSDPILAAEAFDKQRRHDIVKNNFTLAMNISILRISYLDDSKISEYLSQFVSGMSELATSKKKRKQTRVEIFTTGYDNPYGLPQDKSGCTIC
jgi:hypothetical protein